MSPSSPCVVPLSQVPGFLMHTPGTVFACPIWAFSFWMWKPCLWLGFPLMDIKTEHWSELKEHKSDQIRLDQSLSRVRLFATPWIAARQASLSITNSWSSLRLTSIEPVMPQIRISKDTGLTVEVVGKSPTLNVRWLFITIWPWTRSLNFSEPQFSHI